MKYIEEDADGFTNFNKYFSYIESVKHLLPRHIYEFASDKSRYDLRSKKTLHDAWVENISIEYADGLGRSSTFPQITLTLFAQHHDRIHKLVYNNVESYSFKSFNADSNRKNDLLTHEIRLDGEFIVHELLFDNSAEVMIVCSDISHTEQLV